VQTLVAAAQSRPIDLQSAVAAQVPATHWPELQMLLLPYTVSAWHWVSVVQLLQVCSAESHSFLPWQSVEAWQVPAVQAPEVRQMVLLP
jgi:isopentenyldiphosphate isomerase